MEISFKLNLLLRVNKVTFLYFTLYHVMFACKMDTIYKHKPIFEDRYSKYVKGFTRRCNQDKLKEIMNVNPRCSSANRENATKAICNYIKILYNMINASIIET